MNWKDTAVSIDGTHHTLDGTPLYSARFDEVLKFHAPGLAPVRRGGWAWHIDVQGRAAYAQQFDRTFGFYHDRAAVVSETGWLHILQDGQALYDARYAWCGNFQGGLCAVRDPQDTYLHIDLKGRPAYEPRWRYAGDFKYGIAVVQRGDGLSSHIRADGSLLHDRWFLDLDVFHKGSARARDARGWTHIDKSGAPLYEARYAMVEPFYNGQARIETHCGALQVIDEQNDRLLTLREDRGRGQKTEDKIVQELGAGAVDL